MALPGKIDLNALPLFAAVAESGSFTAAAERLGVAKAKVSLEVGRLEAQLGTSLFTRTTRRVALTDAGQALHAECLPLLRGLDESLAQLAGGAAQLRGTLRVGATVDHSVQSLAQALAEFAALHPALQIELRTTDRVTDLVQEGLDLSIRIGWLRDSALRATRLGDFEQYVVAAPAYLARAGRPRHPAELAEHEWLGLTLLPTPWTWKFTGPGGASETVRTRGRFKVDSGAALRALLLGGAGISIADQFSVGEGLATGRLVRVLQDWSLPQGGVHAVYPPGRHVPAKVRAFIDFYGARLRGRG